MLYPPDVILAELRHFLVLEDFDIVMTGTPAGVGPCGRANFHGRVLDGERELVNGAWWPSKRTGHYEFSVSAIVTRRVFQYRQ